LEGIIFLSSVSAFVHASICDVFSRHPWCALIDFHQTFVGSAFWEKDELIKFWGQKIKGQGYRTTVDQIC